MRDSFFCRELLFLVFINIRELTNRASAQSSIRHAHPGTSRREGIRNAHLAEGVHLNLDIHEDQEDHVQTFYGPVDMQTQTFYERFTYYERFGF